MRRASCLRGPARPVPRSAQSVGGGGGGGGLPLGGVGVWVGGGGWGGGGGGASGGVYGPLFSLSLSANGFWHKSMISCIFLL